MTLRRITHNSALSFTKAGVYQLPLQQLRERHAQCAHQVAALQGVDRMLLHRNFDLDVTWLLSWVTRALASNVTHAPVKGAGLDVVLDVGSLQQYTTVLEGNSRGACEMRTPRPRLCGRCSRRMSAPVNSRGHMTSTQTHVRCGRVG
jgi:hypothetical protein